MKKKRMRASRIVLQIVSISFSMLMLLLAAVGVYEVGKNSYQFGYRVFTEEAVDDAPGTDVLVRVKKDMSDYELAQIMERKHLVKSANLFFVQLKLSSKIKKVEAGTYTLNTSMDVEKMMDIFAKVDEKEKTSKAEK
ncbi:MAG: aminodeoxychorismate lyase [Lachnospiraceae bacterium]